MTSPIFLHMLGIPGAGKTTFLNILEANWTGADKPYLLGFDQVMQAMPDYQAEPDKIKAFEMFELPAREKGYQILETLIAEKQSLFFDNGGSAASHLEILTRAKESGYTIILVSIATPITIAQRHVDQRSIIEGRHTPMTYLEDRAQKISALIADYRALTPHFYEITNDGLNMSDFEKSCYNLAQELTLKFGKQAA
ncbi:MAG TPA: zeta toxin family protein [Alphaproteobacteria bacterium]|nr:zeta toxin family protein [Alphaproteobacteria bacterium]HOO50210.1 zeta toxin family protein [Alphaproteobacteria bacterium]